MLKDGLLKYVDQFDTLQILSHLYQCCTKLTENVPSGSKRQILLQLLKDTSMIKLQVQACPIEREKKLELKKEYLSC